MGLTNVFYEAVKEKNIRRIRIMMKDSLLIDPTFKEFQEMERVATSLEGLYDTHDGRIFEAKENWNDEYMSKQMVQVVGNFSKERIEHLKNVVFYLRPVPGTVNKKGDLSKNRVQQKHKNYHEEKRLDMENGRFRGYKIASGTMAGAVVGGLVASATSITVLGGAVTGAVVGGIAMTVVTNGGK